MVKKIQGENIEVFITHSSTDELIVRHLVTLLCTALNFTKSSLRCTSIPGCKLPAGADTPTQLRKEIQDAKAYIGLITPASVESTYVLFELGARWAFEGYFAPVLGPGATFELLKGPFAHRHHLKSSERTDMQQLLEEIAVAVARPLQPAQAYEYELDTFVSASIASESIAASKKEPEIPEPDPCPRCKKRGWELKNSRPHPDFDFAGISERTYECSLCGFSEKQNYPPASQR